VRKTSWVGLLCAVTMALGCTCTGGGPKPTGTASKPVLRHVVLFKFKPGTTPEQIKQVEDAFRALPAKIPAIAGFEWGTDNSPERLSQGFTHCFVLTFRSDEDRAVYLPHPDHKAFGAILRPYLDGVLVVDYWANR
jgi:hypothetical protein